MKVLHLPTSVGGNSWGLAQGEKSLGINSTVLVQEENQFKYKSDIYLYNKNTNKYTKIFQRIKAFLQIRDKFDVFHFNFGTTLIDFQNSNLHYIDLPYYKGKKVMTFNGSDIRQNLNLHLNRFISEIYELTPYNNFSRNELIKKRIKILDKNIDHFFSLNPDLMYFLPKEKTTFLPYTISGWDQIKSLEYNIDNKIKIVHAPTNRLLKGSTYILSTLEKLQEKYKNLEVIVIENLPHEEALKHYKEAHIVIDQLLVGWYGAFGVEVMKMGKPLAVFIREEDLSFIPMKMKEDLLNTVININKENIESILEFYINNPSLLFEKSALSLKYVNKWHNPKYVAELVNNLYQNLNTGD